MAEAGAPHPATVGRVGSALASAALLLLLVNVVLIAFDVGMRWLLRSPQSWVADIAQLSYPVAIACCFPAAIEAGHMISIRFLGAHLGARGAWALDLLGQICLALLMILFTWKMFDRAITDWNTGYTTSNIALPVAPSWLIVALLLLVTTVLQLRETWRLGRRA